MTQRKTYSKKLKAETLRLTETSSITQVDQDLGIHPNMLYLWKRQFDKSADKAFPGRGNPTDPELAQLRKDNARLKEEVEIFKKSSGYLSKSLRERYSVIRQLGGRYKIAVLCKLLKCSTSGYYSWQKGKDRKRELHRHRLTTLIRTTYYGSERTYSSPRIYK